MGWALKFLLKLGLVVLLVFLTFRIFSVNQGGGKDLDLNQFKPSFSAWENSQLKAWTKEQLTKIKHFIYRQAEEHNPEGDVLPDQADDVFWDYLKKKLP